VPSMVFFETHGLTDKATFLYYKENNFNFSLHFHPAYEILLVESGKLIVTLDDQTYTVKKNEAIFIHSHQRHKIETPETSTLYVVLFSSQLISDFDQQYRGMVATSPVIPFNMWMDFNQLSTTYHHKAFLYQFLSRFIEATTFVKTNKASHHEELYPLLMYIEETYHLQCSLKEAARLLNYDYTYVSKLFKETTGLNFIDYVNQYRIAKATDLLRNSNDTISEIAKKTGYETLRTFNRNFLKWMDMTASDFRKNLAS
jgi:AraC-like DNA-binding protein/mannose-6-phosphate isomerase-like protein (cupin superfamily)